MKLSLLLEPVSPNQETIGQASSGRSLNSGPLGSNGGHNSGGRHMAHGSASFAGSNGRLNSVQLLQ